MPESVIEQILSRATADVLEKMFFTGVMEESAEILQRGPQVAVRLRFDGKRHGILSLTISTATARTLTADFLGEESPETLQESQVQEVVRELANMICGDALSALEEGTLVLSCPEVVGPANLNLPAGSSRSFNLDNGTLAVALDFRNGVDG